VIHAEEKQPLPATLAGLPVVCCSLHSQVAPVCAGLGAGKRLAYVQVAGGALPVSLSDTLRALREQRFIEAAIAVAPCVDGDVQCVTLASALLWAASQQCDAVICSIGPGIVGTGSAFGHGAVAAADAANVTAALAGTAIVAVRASESDSRDRHRGVSHHTHAVLQLCVEEVTVAWPAGWEPGELDAEEVDVTGWEEECAALPLSHMGRGPREDPLFFAAAFAAGRAARQRLA
jgi:hypothetical protein